MELSNSIKTITDYALIYETAVSLKLLPIRTFKTTIDFEKLGINEDVLYSPVFIIVENKEFDRYTEYTHVILYKNGYITIKIDSYVTYINNGEIINIVLPAQKLIFLVANFKYRDLLYEVTLYKIQLTGKNIELPNKVFEIPNKYRLLPDNEKFMGIVKLFTKDLKNHFYVKCIFSNNRLYIYNHSFIEHLILVPQDVLLKKID